MPLPYEKPWEELSQSEKIERLHKDLRSFINFQNNDALQRNKHRALLEEALRRIEVRVERLEKPEAP